MQNITNSPRPQPYIAGLDGLRAIAVLSVLLFHVDIQWFKGGFIGVDVFFVISGFIITRNILLQIEANRFSFSEFYCRRVARLFPALFVTIFFSLISGYFILGPLDLASFGEASAYSLVSLANFFFFFESGYFDSASITKPLLHTWSLAVEEQFYLFWPALLVLAAAILKKQKIIFVLIGVGLVSLIFSFWMHGDRPETVFYLMPFRIWQFASGAIIATIGAPNKTSQHSVLSAISFIAIFLLILIVDEETNFLILAVVPTIFTALLIKEINSTFSIKTMNNSLLTWVGQRSYSIYLVHWPCVVFYKMKYGDQLSVMEKTALFVVSIILADCLFRLVEKPFRYRGEGYLVSLKSTLLLAGALGFANLFVSAHYWANDGYPDRLPLELQRYETGFEKEWKTRLAQLRTGQCNLPIHTFAVSDFNEPECVNNNQSNKSLLVIGDRYASDAYLVFSEAFPEINFGQVTIPGCSLRHPKRFERDMPCKTLFQKAINEYSERYDGVILASNWSKGHLYRIDDLLQHFEANKIPVILFGQHISFSRSLPRIILSRLSLDDGLRFAAASILQTPFEINDKIKDRFSRRSLFVDFIEVQCPDGNCLIVDDEKNLIYLDDSHLSLSGVKALKSNLREHYYNKIMPIFKN